MRKMKVYEQAYKQGQADLLDTLKREIEIKQACKKVLTISEVVNIIDKYIKLLEVSSKTPDPKELLDDLETKVDTRIRNYGFATSELDTVFTIKNFIRKTVMELKNDTDRTQSMFNN